MRGSQQEVAEMQGVRLRPARRHKYCACGISLSYAASSCACPPLFKGVSYGIRLHTNPFVVPTEAEEERDAQWVKYSIERATETQKGAEALRPTLPPKIRRSGPSVRAGPYVICFGDWSKDMTGFAVSNIVFLSTSVLCVWLVFRVFKEIGNNEKNILVETLGRV
jgi:hypothetical protein